MNVFTIIALFIMFLVLNVIQELSNRKVIKRVETLEKIVNPEEVNEKSN